MKKKILLVEDDTSAIRITSYKFEQSGYEVLVALNGLEGVKKAHDDEPDLIILDVMLPGLDGFQVCRQLKSDSQTARIPILMVSAKAQKVDVSTGLKVGADDYVTKPVDLSKLVDRVESLLARKSIASVPGDGTDT
jgi:DNA-binding response OmpR family regulator